MHRTRRHNGRAFSMPFYGVLSIGIVVVLVAALHLAAALQA